MAIYLTAVFNTRKDSEWVKLGSRSHLDIDLKATNQDLEHINFQLTTSDKHHETPFETVKDAINALRSVNRHQAANTLEYVLID